MAGPIEWRPIGDAPQDGTKIDLYFTGLGRVTDCHFTTRGVLAWAKDEWHGRASRRQLVQRVFLTKPTHFAEILAAPEVA